MAGPSSAAPEQQRADRVITVVEHDTAWGTRFEQTRADILEVARRLGSANHVVAVEHIGSTSVPGLAAKPIIDVMVGVLTWPAAEVVAALTERLGLHHHGELGWPGRHYLTDAPAGANRTLHVHVVAHGSWFWTETLRFRDHLRLHPEDADEYAALKRRLADAHRHDPLAYTESKTEFIRSVLRRARVAAGVPLLRPLAEGAISERELAEAGYPEAAVEHLLRALGLGPDCRVVEAGSGTGQLTRRLVETGAQLVCVEPISARRRQLRDDLGDGVAVLSGRAEEVDVPARSADVVLAGPACRWFDPWAALAEFHRILDDDGRVGLIWNLPDGPTKASPRWADRWHESISLTDTYAQEGLATFTNGPRTEVRVLRKLDTPRA